MKILITGGSGSLGAATLKEIHNRFEHAEIFSPERVELDLLDKDLTSEYVAELKPTHVIHLAAKVFGIQGHMQFPTESLAVNTQIDLNLFSSLFSNPPKWIFYASTVAAYGYPFIGLPIKESEAFTGIPHESEYGYAQSKRFALTYLQILEKECQTKYTYGLFTNLFGLEDRHLEGNGHVLISLVRKAILAKKNDEPLAIWGSGGATRDFISTATAAKIICDLFDRNPGVLNIGSGVEISIKSIADMITEEFSLKNGYIFTGEKEGISRRFLDIHKLSQFSETALEMDSLEEIRAFVRKSVNHEL